MQQQNSENDEHSTIRNALVESLTAILSPDHAVRNSGEDHLKTFEVFEDYFGLCLAEIVVDAGRPLAIRQLASVLLKQHVEAHWSSCGEKFVQPAMKPEVMAKIRQIIVVGLKDPVIKIRSGVAYVISAMATWDWPETWPELLDILVEGLSSGHPDYTHGCMKVLTEFCREITGKQLNQVVPAIFPQLCNILQDHQKFEVRTRSRAVDIFATIANLIGLICDTEKNPARLLLYPILPQFVQSFFFYLKTNDVLISDTGMKIEIVKAFTVLIRNFPNHMVEWMLPLLESMWVLLITTTEQYIREVVNTSVVSETNAGSGCELVGYENLIETLFELVHLLIKISKFKGRVKKEISNLFYYIVLCLQITDDQVRVIQNWTANPISFIDDESEDMYMNNLRVACREILLALFEQFLKVSVPALHICSQKLIQQADIMRTNNDPGWWKLYEATLHSISLVREFLYPDEDECNGGVDFDIVGLLQNFILPILPQNVSPFLIGRSILLASKFCDVLPAELNDKFMTATVASLSAGQATCLRVFGIKAISNYCKHLKSQPLSLQPHIEGMVKGTLSSISELTSKELSLILQALAVILKVDEHFTSMLEPDASAIVISIFLKYSSDPIMLDLTQDIFGILAKNKLCISPFTHRILPTILTVLQTPINKSPFCMQFVGLEILTTLVRNSTYPLDDLLIHQAFPAAYQCTLTTEDSAALQNGGECMRAYVSVALEQILNYRDEKGFNGVFYVIQIINRLLDPKTCEFTATYVGKLINLLISKMGSQLGDNLEFLLKAVLSKLQQARTLTVVQSLVLVFARLFQSQHIAVIEFLCSVPSPTGQSALEFVLNEWCSKQHLFFGDYDRKVSSIALCKLVEYSLTSNDDRIKLIETKGEQILPKDDGCVRTRSKSAKAPIKWTVIPLLVKMYKLLVNELSNQIEQKLSKDINDKNSGDDEDGMDDDDDDACSESDDENLFDFMNEYIIMINTSYSEFESDGEEHYLDPDDASDPVNQIDLQAYITDFLRTLSQQPCYRLFTEHHNESEKKVLNMVGISV
ncbi:hypothetical protein HELRODRAFT_76488 [Helobdella robusta]|uniref:Importin N-terminal domain-containing protein n=1 Tax=Helobdella robusta TaxID=6412 RepID=T1G2K6_HELRO|nr:hypothetical protein HELRODRAFT_76488 [Helobdella robusta]ESO07416.1 hypothetical protein HELRODRAFT_76488 [Helobdella robusta]